MSKRHDDAVVALLLLSPPDTQAAVLELVNSRSTGDLLLQLVSNTLWRDRRSAHGRRNRGRRSPRHSGEWPTDRTERRKTLEYALIELKDADLEAIARAALTEASPAVIDEVIVALSSQTCAALEICLAQLAASASPQVRLNRARMLVELAEVEVTNAVAMARESGISWSDIANLLRMSPQGARNKYRPKPHQ